MSDLHAAAGAYAVDALEPAERADFEAHLAGCAGCRSEVAEFADTLAELAPLASLAPAADLRDSVLAAVAGLAKTGPQRASRSAERADRVEDEDLEVAPRRALASVTELRPLEPHEVAPLEEHPSVVPDLPWLGVAAVLSEDMGRRSRWRDRLFGGLLAGALLLALVLGGWVFVSQRQVQTLQAQQQQEAELLTAPDATIYPETLSGSSVSWVVSESSDKVLLVANDLPKPEDSSIYQIWIIRSGGPTSVGQLTEGGEARLMISTPVSEGDRLGLTREPGPIGSTSPTEPLLADVGVS